VIYLSILSLYCDASPVKIEEINKFNFANILFNEIERLDASAIKLRDTYKTVSWFEYRKFMTNKIIEANTLADLAFAMDSIQQGFTNKHSYIQLYPNIYDSRLLYQNPINKRGLKIGFTYPEIHFFSFYNKKHIKYINGINIKERFDKFEQLECEYIHKVACLNKFTKRIGFGLIDLNIKSTIQMESENSEKWTETLFFHIAKKQKNKKTKQICASYKENFSTWNLQYSSPNICILNNKDNIVLLKISQFAQWGTSEKDYNCIGEAEYGTLCHDIKKLRLYLSTRTKIKLIIDVQDNRGGSENTPFISLLTKHNFYDNLIKYRNTIELENKAFRESIFYGVKAAENWYQKLDTKNNLIKKQFYLPKRTDFCRADESCSYKAIQSVGSQLDITDIAIVVNSTCVSSCDDFVWRLKTYANAYIIGQPPVTDSTYVSVTGIIYILPNRKIKAKIIGPNQKYTLENGAIKLAWFTVPYTITVDNHNNIIDGNPSVLNQLVPITINNFDTTTHNNIEHAITYIKSK